MNEKESKAKYAPDDYVVLLRGDDQIENEPTLFVYALKSEVLDGYCYIGEPFAEDGIIAREANIRHATPAEIKAGHRIDHPCTPCPNFTNDTCCHSATKPELHPITLKVWGRI